MFAISLQAPSRETTTMLRKLLIAMHDLYPPFLGRNVENHTDTVFRKHRTTRDGVSAPMAQLGLTVCYCAEIKNYCSYEVQKNYQWGRKQAMQHPAPQFLLHRDNPVMTSQASTCSEIRERIHYFTLTISSLREHSH